MFEEIIVYGGLQCGGKPKSATVLPYSIKTFDDGISLKIIKPPFCKNQERTNISTADVKQSTLPFKPFNLKQIVIGSERGLVAWCKQISFKTTIWKYF